MKEQFDSFSRRMTIFFELHRISTSILSSDVLMSTGISLLLEGTREVIKRLKHYLMSSDYLWSP